MRITRYWSLMTWWPSTNAQHMRRPRLGITPPMASSFSKVKKHSPLLLEKSEKVKQYKETGTGSTIKITVEYEDDITRKFIIVTNDLTDPEYTLFAIDEYYYATRNTTWMMVNDSTTSARPSSASQRIIGTLQQQANLRPMKDLMQQFKHFYWRFLLMSPLIISWNISTWSYNQTPSHQRSWLHASKHYSCTRRLLQSENISPLWIQKMYYKMFKPEQQHQFKISGKDVQTMTLIEMAEYFTLICPKERKGKQVIKA